MCGSGSVLLLAPALLNATKRGGDAACAADRVLPRMGKEFERERELELGKGVAVCRDGVRDGTATAAAEGVFCILRSMFCVGWGGWRQSGRNVDVRGEALDLGAIAHSRARGGAMHLPAPPPYSI